LTTALAAVGSDPWLDLDPLRSPAEADRYAREHSGRLDAQDPRRVAGLVSWLVRRAALDGSTVVSVDVVSAVLRGYEVLDPAAGAELALRESRVAAFADDRLLGHPSESVAEERVADSLVALVTEGSVASGAGISAAELTERVVASPLTVAEVPRGDTRRGLLRAVESVAADPARYAGTSAADVDKHRHDLASADVVVIDDAEQLSLSDGAWLLECLTDGTLRRLVLLGDSGELDGAMPGRFLGDVVESGVVPVCTLRDVRQTAPLGVLGAGLRNGRLPALASAERSVVVTPAANTEQALTRAEQLVSTSVPRVFGVPPADTRLATLRTKGACGAAALTAVAGDSVRVGTLEGITRDSCGALVLVVPAESAGSLTRAALLSAAACASQHLSIVHQAGPALAEAVARRPRRPRRTRLARLLSETLG
jgi:hypothetical protein